VRLRPLGTSANNWLIVPAPDGKWWVWSGGWNENWQGKPKYSEKTCPSATLSTTNPTWPDLGSNPGRRGGKLATNRLSYGAAYMEVSWDSFDLGLYRFTLRANLLRSLNEFLRSTLSILTSDYRQKFSYVLMRAIFLAHVLIFYFFTLIIFSEWYELMKLLIEFSLSFYHPL
jgi:hypothetical protein